MSHCTQRSLAFSLMSYSPLREIRNIFFLSMWWADKIPWGDSLCDCLWSGSSTGGYGLRSLGAACSVHSNWPVLPPGSGESGWAGEWPGTRLALVTVAATVVEQQCQLYPWGKAGVLGGPRNWVRPTYLLIPQKRLPLPPRGLCTHVYSGCAGTATACSDSEHCQWITVRRKCTHRHVIKQVRDLLELFKEIGGSGFENCCNIVKQISRLTLKK